MNDLKFAFRQLLKNPGFTAVAVLSLALGIGAGTAIFSLVNAILLSSLPVPNPHQLRLIKWSGTDWESIGEMRLVSGRNHNDRFLPDAVSLPVFQALREQCAAHADIFGYSPIFGGSTFRARHEAVGAQGLMVSGNFFSGLGVRPMLGRLLGADDERAGAAPAVVISYRLWEEQFDLDPAAVGQPVTIGAFSFTVVGVLSREFPGVRPGAGTEFYLSLSSYPQLQGKVEPDYWFVALMARLKPGVNDAQCQAGLNAVFTREAETVMKKPKVWMTAGRGGADEDRKHYGRALLLLLGVVGLVLLVACANLAGLLLARGAVRQHEFAVRAALGASRGRLVRQSLTECVLVALLGGGLGMIIAIWGKTPIGRLLAGSPDGLHYDTSLDLRVLSFTVATSLITALLSGLLPAWRAANVNPLSGLKDRATLGAPRLRAGRFLVAAQISLSLLLVCGAGLFVRTLVNLTHINNTGYAMDHLLVFRLYPSDVNTQHAFAFFDRVQESLAAIPGVRSAAFSAWPSGDYGFQIPGDTSRSGSQMPANLSFVSETFFTTMGIPVVLGRKPRAPDDAEKPKVVVVNETFVRKYLPGRNPIGLTIKRGDEDLQIVGVCRDAKYMDMDIRREATPMVHFSSRQLHPRFACFILRTALPPLAMTTAARTAVAAIDPSVPLIGINTQEQVREATISRELSFATLCGSLAVLAVLLSCIGLYGLMAYQVARRTGEIGIRLALGATRWQPAGPILREALLLAGAGVAIGTPLTLALTRLIRSNLYGVGPSDPITHCGAVVVLLAVALTAAWIPARRAAKVDPMEALRHE